MDRISFLKSIGLTCLCGSAITSFLQNCTASRVITGSIAGDELIVSLNDFDPDPGSDKDLRKYIIVQNDLLQFPVCVYRFNDKEYSALWLQCTHQGNELQVSGEMLQCPAHGSEFDNKGGVQNGPAEENLRTFPVVIENDHIRISLKAR